MFGNKKETDNSEKVIADLVHKHEMEIQRMKQDKELALKEKEFDLKHFKDDEIQKAKEEVSTLKQKVAVLEKENEMLGKITNLNADIIDIKDLVANLIGKLPEIKLSNLTVNNGSGN